MNSSLKEKVVVVMGGTSGIGRASAIEYARWGAAVLVVGRRIKEGEKVVTEIEKDGGEAKFMSADLSIPSDINAVIDTVVDRYGRIDCAFNNAATEGPIGDLTALNEDEVEDAFQLNLTCLWHSMKREIEQMARQRSGVIVNTSSIGGLRGIAESSVYCATKHGVIGFTMAAAVEHASNGIRINAIAPGSIETDMLTRVAKGDASGFASIVPMGRLGKPEEVAKAVVWLSSDEASFITGHTLVIDGGTMARL
jgi:NAD(P)-dependent dehydrogenase (short-subunit alcohol dehydrogenase family)